MGDIVMAPSIKRDLYSEVTSRILAELERGAAPWIKPWAATSGQDVLQNAVSNRPYSGCHVILLWLTRGQGWPTPRFVTYKQAQETGGSVRKGEHGTKVYFVKQLRVKEGEAERLVPMMREYTVFNVAPCEGLRASIVEAWWLEGRAVTNGCASSCGERLLELGSSWPRNPGRPRGNLASLQNLDIPCQSRSKAY
jgi:antirestriction protein ArdC